MKLKHKENILFFTILAIVTAAIIAFLASCTTANKVKKYTIDHPEILKELCEEPEIVHDTVIKIDTVLQVIQPNMEELNNSIAFWRSIDSLNCEQVRDSILNWYANHPVKVVKTIVKEKIIKDTQLVPDEKLIEQARAEQYEKDKKDMAKGFDWWRLAWFVTAGLALLIILFLIFRKKK